MRPGSAFRKLGPLAFVALTPVLAAALFYAAGGAKRAGADERAEQAVRNLHSYRPWFAPLRAPRSAGAEALLFLAQSAAGAAGVVYAVVRLRARRKS